MQNRLEIIRQYDITNIVLIAIRPNNNTQIMDIIEKYDLFYNIQNEITEKIFIIGRGRGQLKKGQNYKI